MDVEVTVNDSGGSKSSLSSEMKKRQKDLLEEVVKYWYNDSQEKLLRRASDRASRQGTEESGLHRIAASAVEPYWDEQNQSWNFGYNHVGAIHNEFGAEAHEITASKSDVLAFEWPNAPEKVKEQFSHTEGDLVFFKSVNHPGIPAVSWVRDGRDSLKAKLDSEMK